jgi:two-component SAPR family response regulator
VRTWESSSLTPVRVALFDETDPSKQLHNYVVHRACTNHIEVDDRGFARGLNQKGLALNPLDEQVFQVKLTLYAEKSEPGTTPP